MKRISLALMLSILCIQAFGQVKYSTTGQLTIGTTTPYAFYTITIEGTGIYLQDTDKDRFLLYDLRWSNPRIAGHNDQIVFYNTHTMTFNDIQVRNVLNYSDANAKTNISSLQRNLDKVCSLRPVSFTFTNTKKSSMLNYGLIAQEVEKIYPNLVYTDDEGKKFINYDGLIPLLLQAIKDLRTDINELEKQINQQ